MLSDQLREQAAVLRKAAADLEELELDKEACGSAVELDSVQVRNFLSFFSPLTGDRNES